MPEPSTTANVVERIHIAIRRTEQYIAALEHERVPLGDQYTHDRKLAEAQRVLGDYRRLLERRERQEES